MNGLLKFTRGRHDVQKTGYYQRNQPSEIVTDEGLLPFFFSVRVPAVIPDDAGLTVSGFTLQKLMLDGDEILVLENITLDTLYISLQRHGAIARVSFLGNYFIGVDSGLYRYELVLTAEGTNNVFTCQPFRICGQNAVVEGDFNLEFTEEFF